MASTVNPRRLLAVKLADLGDALTATPALRACRETWPEAQMDVLTTTAGAAALKGLDSIDRLYVADKHAFDRPAASLTALLRVAPLLMTLRGHRYDVVLLMHHLTTPYGALKYLLLKAALSGRQTAGLDNGRGRFLDLRATDRGFGWRHEVDYNLAVAEAAGARLGHDPLIEIALSEADRDFARQRLAGSGEWVAVHAGGGSYSLARRWAPAEFAAVARQLDLPIVLLGTQVDRAANAEVARLAGGGSLDLTGQTTAKQTASLLERCRLLISNDSGVVHLAAAVGTPVVAVFGPSNDLAWGPYPARRHRVVRTSLPCSPCFYRGTSLGQPGGCETRDCLRLVTPEMVLRAARELLASPAVA